MDRWSNSLYRLLIVGDDGELQRVFQAAGKPTIVRYETDAFGSSKSRIAADSRSRETAAGYAEPGGVGSYPASKKPAAVVHRAAKGRRFGSSRPDELFELHFGLHVYDAEALICSDREVGRRFGVAILNMSVPPDVTDQTVHESMWMIDSHLHFIVCTKRTEEWRRFSQRCGMSDRLSIINRPIDSGELISQAQLNCERRNNLSESLRLLDRIESHVGAESRTLHPIC